MKIMFNAGHWIGEPGKRPPDGSFREWEISDKVVDELMKLAVQYKGVQVRRADDPTGKRKVELYDRAKAANDWGADIYVSVHQNAMGSTWNNTRGTEVFAYPTSSKGKALAKTVVGEVVAAAGTINRGQKTANFQELRQTNAPAILVECEFMTNRDAAAWMKTPGYAKTFAEGIMNGIRKHYGLVKETPTPPPKPKPTPPSAATSTPKSGNRVHRVIVDGKQIGAYGNDANVAEQVQKALANNPKLIRIELVD